MTPERMLSALWAAVTILALTSPAAVAQDPDSFQAGYEEGVPPAEYEKKGSIVENLIEVTRIFSGEKSSRDDAANAASLKAYLDVTAKGVLHEPESGKWKVTAKIVKWNQHIGGQISGDKKARLAEEASYMKTQLGRWEKDLSEEQIDLLKGGDSIEITVRAPFRLTTLWSPKPTLTFRIRGKGAPRAVEIVFLQSEEGRAVETEKLFVRGAFYVKVTFDKKPKKSSRKVTLTFNTGHRKTVTVTASRFGPKIYDTAALHLPQLARFPKLPKATPPRLPEVKKPAKQKYPHKTTARLKYEEVLEGPPKDSPNSIAARIDDQTARATIVMRGATVRATLELPIELKLKEAEGEKPGYFHLKLGGHNLKIDQAMPQASAAILKEETKKVEDNLKEWRAPLKDALYTQQWLKEGLVTFLIAKPFEALVKFSKPQVTLSKERPLNLDGKDLVPVIKLLYARLMQKCALEKRMAQLLEKLKKGNASVENAAKLHKRLEQGDAGIDALDEYLRDYAVALASPHLERFDPTPYEKRIAKLEKDIPAAERELKTARDRVLVKMGDTITFARRPGAGVTHGAKKRDSLRRMAKQLKDYVKNERNLDADKKKELLTKANRLEGEADQIQRIVDDRTSFRKRTVERLKRELADQKRTMKEAREAGREAREKVWKIRSNYYKHQEAYAKLVKDIQSAAATVKSPPLRVPRIPSLPESADGVTSRKLYAAANALIATRASLRAWRKQQEKALEVDFVAYLEAQSGYSHRLRKVAEAMKLAIKEARGATSSGSQAKEDTFKLLGEELDRIKSTIDEADSLYSESDSRLEKFEKLLDYAKTSKGKGLVKKARDKMETLGKVAGRFKKYAEYADVLKRGVDLYKEGKPDDYLKYSLEIAGKLGGKLKVRGSVLGDFLGFYAEAGAKSLEAAHNLRDKYVENSMAALFDSRGKGKPERRLYTRAQIKSAVYHGTVAHDAEEKVVHLAVMWQLRRLMFLLTHASDCARIPDAGGLRY